MSHPASDARQPVKTSPRVHSKALPRTDPTTRVKTHPSDAFAVRVLLDALNEVKSGIEFVMKPVSSAPEQAALDAERRFKVATHHIDKAIRVGARYLARLRREREEQAVFKLEARARLVA